MNKFKKKFQYWFDNQMSKGTGAMILMLAVLTIVVVIVIVGIINGIEPSEDGVTSTAWDVITTVINAWMPYSEDGGLGFLIPTAIAAMFGLLFTSVLIGIVSTAIEEKIDSLKKGNSLVVEEGHTVVLGFESGAYEVISQLIAAVESNEKLCLVVAGEGEKDEMEAEIRDNIVLPKNVKLIYRKIDICSTAALECCSIETAKSVIISCYDDMKTVKSALAVINRLKEYPEANVRITTSVTRNEFLFPETLTKRNNIQMIQTNDVIARIIAHACSQPGIAKTFIEVMNFEGAELYVNSNPDIIGKTFSELYQTMDDGVPVGLLRGEDVILGQALNETLQAGDRLVYMAKVKNGYKLTHQEVHDLVINEMHEHEICESRKILIIGCNEQIERILLELPESVKQVVFAEVSKRQKKAIKACSEGMTDRKISFESGSLMEEGILTELTEDVNHVILLNNEEKEREESDVHNILVYLKLVDLQIRLGRTFNITIELNFENNRELIRKRNNTDFVVANNMSAMLLSQLAVTPHLNYVFDELLSNEGVEIRL
ncbi:MAG: hypothetical protein MJ117_09075, partial [Lachnospiraceae bacterium]|nr:hypothetical protein [Lachnospiraceae bacterium]